VYKITDGRNGKRAIEKHRLILRCILEERSVRAQNVLMPQERRLVSTALAFRFHKKREFLDYPSDYQLLEKDFFLFRKA
jgi:hypothetical protein